MAEHKIDLLVKSVRDLEESMSRLALGSGGGKCWASIQQSKKRTYDWTFVPHVFHCSIGNGNNAGGGAAGINTGHVRRMVHSHPPAEDDGIDELLAHLGFGGINASGDGAANKSNSGSSQRASSSASSSDEQKPQSPSARAADYQEDRNDHRAAGHNEHIHGGGKNGE